MNRRNALKSLAAVAVGVVALPELLKAAPRKTYVHCGAPPQHIFHEDSNILKWVRPPARVWHVETQAGLVAAMHEAMEHGAGEIRIAGAVYLNPFNGIPPNVSLFGAGRENTLIRSGP